MDENIRNLSSMNLERKIGVGSMREVHSIGSSRAEASLGDKLSSSSSRSSSKHCDVWLVGWLVGKTHHQMIFSK